MIIILTMFIISLLSLYLAILALIGLYHDSTLTKTQKLIQSLFVIIIPILGPIVILRLCILASPDKTSVARFVPWPFSTMVFDKPITSNPYAETHEQYKRRMWNI